MQKAVLFVFLCVLVVFAATEGATVPVRIGFGAFAALAVADVILTVRVWKREQKRG